MRPWQPRLWDHPRDLSGGLVWQDVRERVVEPKRIDRWVTGQVGACSPPALSQDESALLRLAHEQFCLENKNGLRSVIFPDKQVQEKAGVEARPPMIKR